jgi:dihydrofolate synthase/folylpolyglutamate synthase
MSIAGAEPFKNSVDVFAWLSDFINLEAGQKPPSFNPDRMKVIAGAAGNPQLCAPAFHTAGSKGKGSVTAMISAILQEAGLRPARYMSPHVSEYRERITQNDDFFDESIYCRAGNILRRTTDLLCNRSSREYKSLQEISEDAPGGNAEPTFFELLTLYFFLCAKEGKCKTLAVETGMGGRLDPTNIVTTFAAVITGVELEHTEFLGNTVTEIATEKAGIIKKNRPIVLGEQSQEALLVFQKTAAEKNAELLYQPDIADIQNVKLNNDGTDFTLVCKNSTLLTEPLDLVLTIPGEIQAKNAALAVLAVKRIMPQFEVAVIKRALAKLRIPARFERIHENPVVIIDGAHTNNSSLHCVSTFQQLYGDGGILLFGCAKGKNAAGMAAQLLPHFSTIIITSLGATRVSEPKKVFEVFQRGSSAFSSIASMEFIKESGDAIRYAIDLGKKTGKPILCVGSFYLASDVREYVLTKM